MKHYPYIDMHCDTLFRAYYPGGESFYSGEGHQSIRQMCDAGQIAQFYAIFFPPRGEKQDFVDNDERELPPDQEFFDLCRNHLLQTAAEHPDDFAIAHNYEELTGNSKAGLSSAILTMEDGRLVNGSMDKLRELYRKDVRAIALTWNFANCFGFPNSRDPQIMQKGLTEFGKEAVREMNRLGMLIDVSHLSDGGFADVAALSSKPFIASHSNCRALTDHPRNLTDDMIRTLANAGGVTGLNLYSAFLHPDPSSEDSRIEDMVRHVLHMIQIGGEDCVGIGTDFDGMHGNLEIEHPAQLDLLFDTLKRAGVTESQLDKISYKNVMRVINDSMR